MSRFGKTIKAAKKLTRDKVFQAPQKAGVDVASFDVLGKLIEEISTGLLCLKYKKKVSREHNRLVEFTLHKDIAWIKAASDFELLLTTADHCGDDGCVRY